MSQRIEVFIDDSRWPRLRGQVIREGSQVQQLPTAYYDVAASQFEPVVRNAVQIAVDALIKRHKGES